MGHMVAKGFAGDSGGRRQEGWLNTTISQKRDSFQRRQQQRSNRECKGNGYISVIGEVADYY
jgi:hypothetical protein